MALENIVLYDGVVPKSGGLTEAQELQACIDFRDWEYTELAVKLVANTPEINKAIEYSGLLFDTSNFQGEHVAGTLYAMGDSVSIGQEIYISKTVDNASTPPNTSWILIYSEVPTETKVKEVLDRTFYIDAVNGLDTNDGLTTSTQCKTIAGLWGKEYFIPGGFYTIVLIEGQTVDLIGFNGIKGFAIEFTSTGAGATIISKNTASDRNGLFIIGYNANLIFYEVHLESEASLTPSRFTALISMKNGNCHVAMYKCNVTLTNNDFIYCYPGLSHLNFAGRAVSVTRDIGSVAKFIYSPGAYSFTGRGFSLTNITSIKDILTLSYNGTDSQPYNATSNLDLGV